MRNQHDNEVGDELKAVAQDMLALGARAMETGRGWLNGWRSDLNERASDGHRPGSGGSRGYRSDYRSHQAYGSGQAHERDHRDHRGSTYGWQAQDQRGMGYGNSSGYGSPHEYSYAGGDYDRPSFVNPADTQFRSGQYGATGNYRGYGPRDYIRSDARIREDLCERLTEDPAIDPRDVRVQVSDGTVTLEGTVQQRWMKHRAEDLADSCGGVHNVENRIRVQSHQTHAPGGSGQRASGGSETGSPGTPTSRAASASGSEPPSGSSGTATH